MLAMRSKRFSPNIVDDSQDSARIKDKRKRRAE
jgi:hypothetical protein